MSSPQANDAYLIDSAEEMVRLERQAALYGSSDDLEHLALGGSERVLDAGCGAGVITRTIARVLPGGRAVGLDREPRYVEYARQKAASEGIGNVEFETGDVLSLPFRDGTFDVVWSKHLLQWVSRREQALQEFVRVAKPGGRVIAANFDGFLLQHHPQNPQVQADLERWFGAARDQMGFDNWIGRKLPTMFKDAGLTDIRVDTIPDRAYSGLGSDAERVWNMRVQWEAAMDFSARVFGSREASIDAMNRILDCFSDPRVYFHCTMFYVEGRVPGGRGSGRQPA
jgi:ubiquinone/menaquinone biosynthesis C-methylase UbiE